MSKDGKSTPHDYSVIKEISRWGSGWAIQLENGGSISLPGTAGSQVQHLQGGDTILLDFRSWEKAIVHAFVYRLIEEGRKIPSMYEVAKFIVGKDCTFNPHTLGKAGVAQG